MSSVILRISKEVSRRHILIELEGVNADQGLLSLLKRINPRGNRRYDVDNKLNHCRIVFFSDSNKNPGRGWGDIA